MVQSGLGISPEQLGRIFDPFYTTKRSGTGLGLSISLALIERYGGTISVDSRPGGAAARIADAALSMLDVDHAGLDVMDRKLLSAIIEKFSGGPVGLDNVAAAIGESADTIEDVLEPYLIQQGLLQRTPRGRMATVLAYQHFGLSAPERLPG